MWDPHVYVVFGALEYDMQELSKRRSEINQQGAGPSGAVPKSQARWTSQVPNIIASISFMPLYTNSRAFGPILLGTWEVQL